MIRQWTGNREVPCGDHVYKTQSLLHMPGKSRRPADKEECTQFVRRSSKRPEGKENPCRAIATQITSTSFKSNEKALSMINAWRQVVNYSLFIDSGTYFRASCCGKYAECKYQRLEESSQFIRACNGNYKACFRVEGDHRRQILPVATLAVKGNTKYAEDRKK